MNVGVFRSRESAPALDGDRNSGSARSKKHRGAIEIIRDEHRSLGAVMHGMLYLIREIRYAHAAPNFAVFHAVLAYIEAFPERFHHPKEDAYLFAFLGMRHPDAAPLIDRLRAEHAIGAEKIGRLAEALAQYEEGGAAQFAAFAEAVSAYAAFHYAHMRAEEDELIPLARRYLTPDDWAEIEDAFAGHTDPLFGVKESAQYTELFRRIVNLAPPPLGLGPAQNVKSR
jgi:hemerythrin-like domain-containing protein